MKDGKIRYDEKGFPWIVNFKKSSRYPNGKVHELVLVSKWGTETKVRYNQIGQFIAGNPALA